MENRNFETKQRVTITTNTEEKRRKITRLEPKPESEDYSGA